MSKRILLTGATGLLGSKLYPFIKGQGYEIIGHGNTAKADVNCDLRCKKSTEQLLDSIRPQMIINLVALTDVERCEQEPQSAYLVNVKTVENIVRWIKSHPRVDLIHISTDQIYDGPGPHVEDNVVLRNIYAFSKYCAETVAGQVKSTILRTNFFGYSNVPGRKSFSDWLIANFKKQNTINLFTDVLFSPLSFSTLLEIMIKIIENPIPGIFNLGSKAGMSKRDFAFSLGEYFSLRTDCARDALSVEQGFRAHRPHDMRMNCELFEKTFDVSLPSLIDEIKRLKDRK